MKVAVRVRGKGECEREVVRVVGAVARERECAGAGKRMAARTRATRVGLGYADQTGDDDMDDEGFVVERGDEDLIIPPTTDENAIEKGKELSLWAALATCAVMYSVPYGFVRWNLHTLAPLLWYELGGATFLGTLMAMPFVAAIGYPAAKYELNMPILARSSFGIWGGGVHRRVPRDVGLFALCRADLGRW